MLGDRQAVIGRELTKLHEEFRRASLSGLLQYFQQQTPRGEFVILVAGRTNAMDVSEGEKAEVSDESICRELERQIAAGANKKDAIKMIASQWKIPRRRVYQLTLNSG